MLQKVTMSHSAGVTTLMKPSSRPHLEYGNFWPVYGIPRSDSGKYQYQIQCTKSNFPVATSIVELSMLYYHLVNTIVTSSLTNNTVVVNTTFGCTCSAQPNPLAKYRFYRGSEYVNGPDNNAVITTSVKE